MPKSVKIASIVVVSLLLVAVVVMLYQQSVPPVAGPSVAKPTTAPTKTMAIKPTPYTPSSNITTERLPGTDSIDPNAEPAREPTPEPSLPRSPSGPVAVQGYEPRTAMPESTAIVEPAGPTKAPATMPNETMIAPPAMIIAPPPATMPAKPAPPSAPQIAEPPRTYTVKSGDTLTSIAQKNLGSEARWHEIAEANPMIDPIKLRIGQVLNMPGPAGAAAPGAVGTPETRPATQPRDPSGRIIYIVRPLDSLASIAKQYYGTRELWKTIYSANRSVIGSNPDKLEPGTRLVIPPAPQPAR
jgi:nucleoid-associated protein YgaU